MMQKKQLELAARTMMALGHPLRLGVLQALVDQEKSVSELYRELNSSQSMMSQQLRILETQGLIQARKEGTTKYFSIQNRDFINLLHCMEKHLKMYFKI